MAYCDFPSSNSYKCTCSDCVDPTGRTCQACKKPAVDFVFRYSYGGGGSKCWYCRECLPKSTNHEVN